MKRYAAIAVLVIAVVGGLFAIKIHQSQLAIPTNTVASKGKYVALGDSVAAGVGLKDYSDSSACNRTEQAYPKQVAVSQHYDLTSIACSGATMAAGVVGQQDVNKLLVQPQLDQLFGRSGKPALVTLTIGANDIHWTDLIQKCYLDTCGTAVDQAQVKTSLQMLSSDLRRSLASIQSDYQSAPPKVVLTGYHQVFPTTPLAGCTDLTGIDADELAWGRQVQSSLSDTVKAAVKEFNFAGFAPVDFGGHELCSVQPWVQGLGDPQPYHPTEAGQAAFAKAVIQAAAGIKGSN